MQEATGQMEPLWHHVKRESTAEKPGRMQIQAVEQMGKMREVVTIVQQSWNVTARDSAAM